MGACGRGMNAMVKKVIGITAITLTVYFVMKYMLVYIAPFLVAFLIVRLLNPLAEKAQKYLPFKKGTIVFLFMTLLLVLAAMGLWFLGARLFAQIRSVMAHIDLYERKLEHVIDGCCVLIHKNLGIESESIRRMLYQNIDQFAEKVQVLNLTWVVQNSVHYAAGFLKWFGAVFLVFVAVLLIIKDYDEICSKLEQYPLWGRAVRVGQRLWGLAGLWLRAQFVILLAVMAECIAGLMLLGNSYALLAGILIGLLDALPFIGTGTILLPWALVWVIKGDFFHAAAYATLFLVTNSTREFMEPRLLGNRLGVYPIVIAVVVYAGICIFGAAGVLFGPLMLLVILEVSREWLGTEK